MEVFFFFLKKTKEAHDEILKCKTQKKQKETLLHATYGLSRGSPCHRPPEMLCGYEKGLTVISGAPLEQEMLSQEMGEMRSRCSFQLCASLGTPLLWQESGNKPA